jgi:tRNA(Ile)-lysidine synthase
MGWSELHARVHQRLRQSGFLPPNQRLILAVSGGQDSLCLGRLLLDLQSKWHWHLAIAHCDHGWSGDGAIAAHVEAVAKMWNLPFYLCSAAAKIPEREAAARAWRYDSLTALAIEKNFDILVTGHTQTDRAETLLYNLVRGSGSAGMGALTWRRSLTPQLTLVRPLLEIARAETATFCEQFSLPIYEDQYNHNLKFARNRLRHNIFPQLDAINPRAEKHLAHTAEILHRENDYLEGIATEYFQLDLEQEKRLYRPKLSPLHPALQWRIVRQFLQKKLSKMPTYQQIEAVVTLVSAPNQSQTSSFSHNISFRVQQDWIVPHYNVNISDV